MKRAFSGDVVIAPPIEKDDISRLEDDDNFVEKVQKVSTDCLSIVVDMCLFYKSKTGESGSSTDSLSVVTKIVGDLVSCIPDKSENSLAVKKRDQFIQNLSLYVNDLEDEKAANCLELENKHLAIENLSSYVIELENDKSKADSEIKIRNGSIEKLISYVDDLSDDNYKLLNGIEDLHNSHAKNIDDVAEKIETSMKEVQLEERESFSSTIQKLFHAVEESEAELGILSDRYERLSRDYVDFQAKTEKNFEYQEMGYLSRISVLEETIFDKDNELKVLKNDRDNEFKVLKNDIKTLSEENKAQRVRIATMEKEKFQPKIISSDSKESEIVNILEKKMKNIKIRPPPILNKVCYDLIEPAYRDHGIILKNFRVDYLEGVIIGTDDIKTPMKTDDICRDCGKAIPFDPTRSFRYHRGVVSNLGGVPRSFGYFHTRCVYSTKYTELVVSRVSSIEQ